MGSHLDRDDIEFLMEGMEPKGIVIAGGICATILSAFFLYNLV